MNTKVLLLTPPFTQLNTPYPATMYLKGFLNQHGVESFQMDLGLDVILKLLNKETLSNLFIQVEQSDQEISENSFRILNLKEDYLACISPVIRFLQNKNSSLAYSIAEQNFLPQASRFQQLSDLDWAFGAIGVQDKAKYLATLFLQDLADFIRETIDPFFGFNRYAERLGLTATTFDDLYNHLGQETTFVDKILIDVLESKVKEFQPDLVVISIPFPGNLYAGLRLSKFLKANYPKVKIAIGGGYPNTELRAITDRRVFEFVDFISLDDGERPLLNIIEFIEEKRNIKQLKRTFALQNGVVTYFNGGIERDFSFAHVGTPDYTDIRTDEYLSILELTNPMHRLWSDGRWNKLTMAHGCYWKKCSFCDISLDYIGRYEPITASLICDRMQTQIDVTGETGFHFVDEAAPPALMKELALELLKRKMKVTWWANIRFETSFTQDLCHVLALSGCVAVSGGLEVASDRLLALMEKGVTVEQVAKVCHHFTEAGILVHAYLMYGFPTQNSQETIDSLENVRQLFQCGVIQSGFWHQFAMTAHSPVGKNPEKYGVENIGPGIGTFANNDLWHKDPKGANHELFSDGLKKSLFNFMHGIGFDFDLQEWFDFKVPVTQVDPNFIIEAIQNESEDGSSLMLKKVVFVGTKPEIIPFDEDKNTVQFELRNETIQFVLSKKRTDFVIELLEKASIYPQEKYQVYYEEYKNKFPNDELENWNVWSFLRQNGLYLL